MLRHVSPIQAENPHMLRRVSPIQAENSYVKACLPFKLRTHIC